MFMNRSSTIDLTTSRRHTIVLCATQVSSRCPLVSLYLLEVSIPQQNTITVLVCVRICGVEIELIAERLGFTRINTLLHSRWIGSVIRWCARINLVGVARIEPLFALYYIENGTITSLGIALWREILRWSFSTIETSACRCN